MLTFTLGVIAAILTIARSWPQFARIVVRKNTSGVSTMTWTLVAINHAGFFVYGLLDGLPLLIVVNALALAGASAIVYKVHSWQLAVSASSATIVVGFALYAISSSLMLATIVCASLMMYFPQLIKIWKGHGAGVSTQAWVTAAFCSAAWIAWGASLGRLTVVAAHFVMLPCSIAIAIIAIRLHSKPSGETALLPIE